MDNDNRKILKFILFLILLIAGGLLLTYPMSYLFNNAAELKGLILGFGMIGPLILIFLIALQVIIAPIPGQAAGVVSGFIYGTAFGTAISLVGVIIGSYVAFYLSRRYGRPFVERIVSKKTLARFDSRCQDNGLFAIFLIFLLPALPDDAVCFMAGLTNIPIRNLVIVSALGRLPGFIVLNLVGSGAASHESTIYIILFGAILAISFAIFWYSDYYEKLMLRITK